VYVVVELECQTNPINDHCVKWKNFGRKKTKKKKKKKKKKKNTKKKPGEQKKK